MTEDVIRLREEISEQIKALKAIKDMAAMYGCDVSRPAKDAREAVQWTGLSSYEFVKCKQFSRYFYRKRSEGMNA